MKKACIRVLVCAVAVVLWVSGLSGCRITDDKDGNRSRETSETAAASTSAPTETTKTTTVTIPETTPEATEAVFEYTWKPHVFSQIDRETIGSEAEQFFFDLVDAILAGEESVLCADKKFLWDLDLALGTYFPPYYHVVSDLTYADGAYRIKYRVGAEEREKMLLDFARRIETLIEWADLREDDSPTIRAVKIYRMYSERIVYDYHAINTDAITDVSTYRGLMELQGICQSFGSAYAYLCLQAGVEAATVSGLSTENAHEWTILTLDGKYYYADPTWESGNKGRGLRYFGMTATQREWNGGYIADEYNVGYSNDFWGREISVTDETFAPLWEAVEVTEFLEEDGVLRVVFERADGSVGEFEFR